MMKQTLLLSVLAGFALSACTSLSYGEKKFEVTPEQRAELARQQRAINAAEASERAQYRKERREEMMDEANAINRAYGNQKIYILR